LRGVACRSLVWFSAGSHGPPLSRPRHFMYQPPGMLKQGTNVFHSTRFLPPPNKFDRLQYYEDRSGAAAFSFGFKAFAPRLRSALIRLLIQPPGPQVILIPGSIKSFSRFAVRPLQSQFFSHASFCVPPELKEPFSESRERPPAVFWPIYRVSGRAYPPPHSFFFGLGQKNFPDLRFGHFFSPLPFWRCPGSQPFTSQFNLLHVPALSRHYSGPPPPRCALLPEVFQRNALS